MIPDEAVEAAAKKLYQAGGLVVWDSEDESIRNYFRRNARSALEAAAPHLMAAAWEEGRIDGYADAQRGFDTAMNPYEGLPDA